MQTTPSSEEGSAAFFDFFRSSADGVSQMTMSSPSTLKERETPVKIGTGST